MIKFFRHIRKTLISENKMGNYFKYAIGEIVLVVIGILIALQINNWNNDRIDKEFETQILNEISKSIQNDLKRNKSILKSRVEPKKIAIEKLIENFNSNEMEHDSILWSYFSKMKLGATLTFDQGSYESLKSAGLNKIKNDSLRSVIINLYDNILPRGKELINIGKDNRMQRKQFLLDNIYSYKDYKYTKAWGIRKEIDFQELRTNKYFRKLADLEEDNYFAYKDRIGFVVEHLEQTLQRIEEYLIKQ